MKRVFLAIALNEDIKNKMKSQVKKVEVTGKKKEWDMNWTPGDNYHITLNFIGDIEEDKINDINLMVSEFVNNQEQFELKVGGVGAFPSVDSARVIWLGVQAKKDLIGLQQELSEKLHHLGLDVEDKDYRPHLTIARLRNKHNVENLISPLKKIDCGKIRVSNITLFESKLVGKYPKYIPLKVFEFSAPT